MNDRTMAPVFLSVSRSRALTRALIWSVPTVLLGLAAAAIYSRLNFIPTGLSNRLVDYSLAVVSAPIPAGALLTAFHTLRWLLFALWPGRLGFFATTERLTARLGPFGVTTFDAAQLEIRYPYELVDDEDAAAFESFLPEEQQHATLLPRIRHPSTKTPINRTILKFARETESEAATALRAVLDEWRKFNPAPDG